MTDFPLSRLTLEADGKHELLSHLQHEVTSGQQLYLQPSSLQIELLLHFMQPFPFLVL